ncbi:glutaredoxin domain-containing protein [Haliea sp. E1-2-M8]|uniref:glutaredoxin domain-containing protein n=1 Tax=Haliea sp. E1-2-M8 TaxID=3064706 RepID=UPI0027220265|nr:glutaredoxin domain-containing protein [Haliea sp. E1-2-M8]MDO8863586.1 glutaredoxin domain-containing protein [Haliea sp. E1-2-M8]
MLRVLPLLLAWLVLVGPPVAASAKSDATSPTQAPVLEVFVRTGCPHCANAKAYLPEFAARHPWLEIRYRAVDEDPQARDDLYRHARASGSWPPGVPTFVFDGRVLVGFADAESSAPQLAALVAGDAPAPTVQSELFGPLSVAGLGLPLFTLAIGLLDGFNPCAMWVLLFLLSMLVRLQSRRRMALVAGTFVLASGVVYYLFMAAWLNLFLLIGLTAWLRYGLAGLALLIASVNIKDAVRPGVGPSLSIPAAAKPGLYRRMRSVLNSDTLLLSLPAVALLAVVVNFIELLCTAGFPALYTAILTQQELPSGAYYGYIGLYILGYIADDALMVTLAVIALGNRKLSDRGGRQLKLLSGLVMLGLGMVMLLRPGWLF